jgi:hypothetical protein
MIRAAKNKGKKEVCGEIGREHKNELAIAYSLCSVTWRETDEEYAEVKCAVHIFYKAAGALCASRFSD